MKPKIEELKVEEPKNDFKELYGSLRNEINKARETYKNMLTQTESAIKIRLQELEILKIRKEKLEGAIEATDELLKVALPSNNKQ